ncbi:hypothetical protein D9M68_512030 [compost metagenome]
MHDSVELHPVLVGENDDSQGIVADGRDARIGVHARKDRFLHALPVLERPVIHKQVELEVSSIVPTVVKAAIDAARRREAVNHPVDAVALQRRQQIVNAVECLGVVVEIPVTAEHQAGIDEMQSSEIVAVHRQLPGVAIGRYVIGKPAGRRAPGE